jgi:hypothetical protein
VRGPLVERPARLVELVDDALVAAGELHRARDDGLEHRVEVEGRAHRLAHLAERLQLADRAGQILGPGL